MNIWIVLIGIAGMVGLLVAAFIAAGYSGVFDVWLAPTEEEEFHE